MSDAQLTIPDPANRITVPLNHVQRVDGDQVLIRLALNVFGAMCSLPVFLTCNEAADLARRLEEFSA